MVQDNQAAAPLFTQLYSGNLSLGAGATLNFGYASGSIEDYRALGTPGATVITTGAGATFGFN
ncbi:hypothetical protein BSZ32_03135 [Rubritalea profundi]|uniref:Uncharacterized protein n=2 Tax=Rubritalea profundi TaxID=1658618 RepID=A0A2S7TZM0_9BACT|nr:hypothetical protein BSZ32_03135 [Rubritalea profundi]